MHFLLSAEDSDRFLIEELHREDRQGRHEIDAPGLVVTELKLEAENRPILVFARQLLPDAEELGAASISAWSERLLAVAMARLPEDQPWRLHIASHYASGRGGQNRCRLLRKAFRALLQRKRLTGRQAEKIAGEVWEKEKGKHPKTSCGKKKGGK